jgi:predicted nucleic acid-binding protein
MTTTTLDAGALIAFERGDRAMLALIVVARQASLKFVVPSAAVAQVWRDGRKQVRLARLLASPLVEVEALTDQRARAAGQLCGVTGTRDIVDAAVALCARQRGGRVITSDPENLQRLDPTLQVIRV